MRQVGQVTLGFGVLERAKNPRKFAGHLPGNEHLAAPDVVREQVAVLVQCPRQIQPSEGSGVGEDQRVGAVRRRGRRSWRSQQPR